MDKVTILGRSSSLFSSILAELRDENIQKDRLRFRFNLERAGEILAYEISRSLSYSAKEVITPLGSLEMQVLSEQPVITSILRAGLPMHNGFLRMFDHADNGFISDYRQHTHGNEFIVKVEYMACPDLEDRVLIITDPMIATGKSLVLSYQSLLSYGKPKEVYIAAVLASEAGIEQLKIQLPHAKIFVGEIDRELTAKSYIVPGLGDAGDLAFGLK